MGCKSSRSLPDEGSTVSKQERSEVNADAKNDVPIPEVPTLSGNRSLSTASVDPKHYAGEQTESFASDDIDPIDQNAAESQSFWSAHFGRNKLTVKVKLLPLVRHRLLYDHLTKSMKDTLGISPQLRQVVKAPVEEGHSVEQWIAVNTCHFYNMIAMIWGSVCQFCTTQTESCAFMTAGPKFQYLWQDRDDPEFEQPQKVPAAVYVEKLLAWTLRYLDDQNTFVNGDEYPKHFMPIVKHMYKRLFRVYSHVYHAHYDDVRAAGATAHLNVCFKHFLFFIQEHNLVSDDEMAPLKRLKAQFSRG